MATTKEEQRSIYVHKKWNLQEVPSASKSSCRYLFSLTHSFSNLICYFIGRSKCSWIIIVVIVCFAANVLYTEVVYILLADITLHLPYIASIWYRSFGTKSRQQDVFNHAVVSACQWGFGWLLLENNPTGKRKDRNGSEYLKNKYLNENWWNSEKFAAIQNFHTHNSRS
jgi:hypothetical protein